MLFRSPNRFGPVFVQAGLQAGFRHNTDFNGADQEGVGMYQVTHKAGERWSAAKGYLTPNRGRSNLTVITNAHTTRILLKGKRAVGVEYVQDGVTQQLTADKEVLLCAGALQSPQILLLSGIGPKDHLLEMGIAVLHELPGVGLHLHDHPDVVQVLDAPGQKELFGISLTGIARALKGIFEWRSQRTGMLTTNFAEAGGFIKSDPSVATPDLQFHFVIAKLADHGRKTLFGHGVSCHVCLLRPKSRGSVRLASKDPMAPPAIDPNFFGDPEDLERLLRGFKLMRNILQQPALAKFGTREAATSANVTTDKEIEHFIRDHADTVYHPVGSCRMGQGPLDVVDAQLKVHGMGSLRVVDASIMPQVVSGNTNAPVIMIAEKAADMIRAAAAEC